MKYIWLHLPTGKEGTGEVEGRTRLEFLELINQWNRVGSNWKYWAIP